MSAKTESGENKNRCFKLILLFLVLLWTFLTTFYNCGNDGYGNLYYMCHNAVMKKRQTHPSAYLYKNMISDALIALLNEKEIGLITVTELCDKAQVSRRTFYRHFNNKNEVVDYYATKIMKSLALELKAASMQDKRSLIRHSFIF